MESSAIRWLRASYIAGAIADGLIGVLMLIPSRMGEVEFRYSMGLGATLMFGWTVLLLWGLRRPMERKGILVVTIPVICGLIATAIWAVTADIFPFEKILPTAIVGSSLIVLFALSYRKARGVE